MIYPSQVTSGTIDPDNETLTFRPVSAGDRDLLFSLYASTRQDEVAAFGWEEQQITAFLEMQFNAREQAYGFQFPGAEDRIILLGNIAVGRLITFAAEDHLVLVDIAIRPEYRSKGIGSRVVKKLQSDAAAEEKPLVLRVDKTNPLARRFYERLGFSLTGESAIAYSMSWQPGP